MSGDRAEALERQVARVRESGVLGRSHGLSRLFDYLADPAREGRTLSEADVAADVFGRELDLSGDASVRVYVHRLRKKLDDFYAGAGASEPQRLVIPVGEYRLDVADAAEVPVVPPLPVPATPVVPAVPEVPAAPPVEEPPPHPRPRNTAATHADAHVFRIMGAQASSPE